MNIVIAAARAVRQIEGKFFLGDMTMITMSYGGGKQTVAIITLILQGELPKPDVIVMADTGREVRTTFEYLDRVVQPALKRIGLQVEIASHDLSKVDLYRNGDLLLPAFTRQNGGLIGKMDTFCSNEWKQRVIRRWLKDRGVTDTDVWLGISMDEAERMKPSGLNWYRHVYPLIEITPMHRSGCVNQIKKFGWEVPKKSRCWMCPNQSPQAWRQMHDLDNGDFERARALEAQIRQKDEDVYLHPLAIDLWEAVKQTEMQSEMFDGCDSGYCFT
jgi:hypothetical protein